MSPWLTLIPSLILSAAGASLTYAVELKGRWWFTPAFGLLALASGLLYGVGVKWCRTDREAFVFSFVWDVAVTAAYVVVPVLAFGVRLSPAGWCWLGGAVFCVIGLKLKSGG